MNVRLSLLAGALAAALGSAAPAQAGAVHALAPEAPVAGWHSLRLAERTPRIGAGEAARLAREAFGGRVLLLRWEGREHRWRVRLLRRGEVFVVFVDGRDGRVWRR